MKLLIVTQKADRKDPILGFFRRWIEEFAKHCEQVTVIAQSVGDHALPKNVRVLSLEKEKGRSRLSQILRFRTLIKEIEHSYDVVLVHMTPVWAVIGSGIWRRLGKRTFLWYEARGGGWALRIAERCVGKIFSASAYGMPFQSTKHVVIGHGIDTEFFHPSAEPRDPHLLCSVGRVTRSKNLDLIARAFAELPSAYRMEIAGGAIRVDDKHYQAELEKFAEQKNISGRFSMRNHNAENVRRLLQKAILFMHASMTALDKALLEAMACECPVLSSAEAARAVLPPECLTTPEAFAKRLKEMLAMPESQRKKLGASLRDVIVTHHGLPQLIERLVAEMS
ncbi:glycosyltransferase family 4 protein [Candidatus Peregrinibacteria bacterium]|nr:glycosyltransferase family 4 protein [Candidatus Peregrinibacteria bacterium]MBI3816624.1 glycosyltransferase family 4 protein [Candidatus Peregrinibacteria bacterium]